MVIVKLTDGLGNQLFQYAIGRNLAERNRVPLRLDLSWFEQNRSRRFGLGYFRVAGTIAAPEEIRAVQEQCTFEETPLGAFRFDERFLQLPSSVYLQGYWQSEKYFRDIRGIILEEFRLRDPLDDTNQRMAAKIAATEAVAVHIRRGDYVTDPENYRLHGVCPLSYYEQAASELASQITQPHFFVFSDDWDWFWALETFNINYQPTFVTLNTAEDGYKDLYLMSLCKYHIIANSTLSWWSAWLSPYPDKVVYAPKQWMAGRDIDTRDLIPDGWVQR